MGNTSDIHGYRKIPKTKKDLKSHLIMVRVTEHEKMVFKQKAIDSGVSVPELLRACAHHRKLYSTLDSQAILNLLKVNADLGRLGGLLKLWLTSPEKNPLNHGAHTLLSDIRSTQNHLKQLILSL